jgi:lipoate-protein ligase A
VSAARLLPYAATAPTTNMAVDAAILAAADRPTLRFYGWDPPAISLGRFQGRREDLAPLLDAGLPVVRRMTGGGAIVHWHELTYSVFLPLEHPAIAGLGTSDSYAALHGPIVRALAEIGVDASSRGSPPPPPGRSPLLCFDRTTSLDLVARGRKLVGSAQRRARGRLLQHGSIILAPNALQPATASLEEILGVAPQAATLAEHIARHFATLLGPLDPGDLTSAELRHIAGSSWRDVAPS